MIHAIFVYFMKPISFSSGFICVSESFPLWILESERFGVFRHGAFGPVFRAVREGGLNLVNDSQYCSICAFHPEGQLSIPGSGAGFSPVTRQSEAGAG